jgi:hypothetical protein
LGCRRVAPSTDFACRVVVTIILRNIQILTLCIRFIVPLSAPKTIVGPENMFRQPLSIPYSLHYTKTFRSMASDTEEYFGRIFEICTIPKSVQSFENRSRIELTVFGLNKRALRSYTVDDS